MFRLDNKLTNRNKGISCINGSALAGADSNYFTRFWRHNFIFHFHSLEYAKHIAATVKHIGIDYADGTRYNSIRTYQDSGSISYTFTQTGLYCCIIEGYNNIGYDCSPGIYIRVTEPYQSPTTFTTYTDNDSYRRFHTEITNLTCDAEYIVASYDSGGQLLEMSNSGISAGEGGCEMTLPKHSGEKYIKVFLWDSLKGMKPLTEVEKITL